MQRAIGYWAIPPMEFATDIIMRMMIENLFRSLADDVLSRLGAMRRLQREADPRVAASLARWPCYDVEAAEWCDA